MEEREPQELELYRRMAGKLLALEPEQRDAYLAQMHWDGMVFGQICLDEDGSLVVPGRVGFGD